MFWNIKLFLPTGEKEKENSAVEPACLQMLNISLCKIFIYLFTLVKLGAILVLTIKNQPTNQKYLHTYLE